MRVCLEFYQFLFSNVIGIFTFFIICLPNFFILKVLLANAVKYWITELLLTHRFISPLSFFFWPCPAACRILVPRPGIEPLPPPLGAQSLNHWTAWEVPNPTIFLMYVLLDSTDMMSMTNYILKNQKSVFFTGLQGVHRSMTSVVSKWMSVEKGNPGLW